jgi:dethiobiotin synthetase
MGRTVGDLISELACPVIAVSCNELGIIDHTVLTVARLDNFGVRLINVVLVRKRKPDKSPSSNHLILKELLHPIPVFAIPFPSRPQVWQ